MKFSDIPIDINMIQAAYTVPAAQGLTYIRHTGFRRRNSGLDLRENVKYQP